MFDSIEECWRVFENVWVFYSLRRECLTVLAMSVYNENDWEYLTWECSRVFDLRTFESVWECFKWECLRLFMNIWECSGMFHNVMECSRMFLNVFECFRML